MDHQPLRRRYGSARHPIPAARCALIRPAHDTGKRTPRRRPDAASRKIHLVATESLSRTRLVARNGKHRLYKSPWSILVGGSEKGDFGIRAVNSKSSVAQG